MSPLLFYTGNVMSKAEKSRQRIWQEKQRKAGKCTVCGEDAVGVLCGRCGRRQKLRQRKANGFKPKKKGGVGRPSIY